jgi:hypothetical protein
VIKLEERVDRLKAYPFEILGIGRIKFTSVDQMLTTKSYVRSVTLGVKLPEEQQIAALHPQLIKVLEQRFGNRLNLLHCSTGKFREALKGGSVSLGHVWEEIYALCFDSISTKLGFGQDTFFFKTHLTKEREDGMVIYKINLIFGRKPPTQLSPALETMVTKFLNAAMGGKSLPIYDWVKKFTQYHRDVYRRPESSYWRVYQINFTRFRRATRRILRKIPVVNHILT